MTRVDSTQDCDVVVLGLGPGGEHAARKLAEAGLQVVGVDEALVGGECPFWGCTPSKLMVRPADLIAEVHRADRLAGDATVRPDWSLVAARIREANHDWTDQQHVEPLEQAGVRIVRGHGRLAGPGVVRVEREGVTTELRGARGVLLNTGTEPLRLPIDGLAETPYWTNREAMKVTEVPRRLVVVGGGPNGLELAQVFARYGAEVTLLEAADRIAAHEEPEASQALTAVLRRRGDRRAGRRGGGAGRPRRRVPPAAGRRGAQQRPAAGRRRPQPQPRRHRSRDRRARPGLRHRRDRRPDARRRAALGGR